RVGFGRGGLPHSQVSSLYYLNVPRDRSTVRTRTPLVTSQAEESKHITPKMCAVLRDTAEHSCVAKTFFTALPGELHTAHHALQSRIQTRPFRPETRKWTGQPARRIKRQLLDGGVWTPMAARGLGKSYCAVRERIL